MEERRPSTDSSMRRIAAAGILSKLAVYFLAFGVVLLCAGGIRSLFFSYGINSRVLVIIGSVTAMLGLFYTLLALMFIKSLGRDVSAFGLWSYERRDSTSNHRSRRETRESIASVSGTLSSRNQQTFSYASPHLFPVSSNHAGHDAKSYWEPPPAYDTVVRMESITSPPSSLPIPPAAHSSTSVNISDRQSHDLQSPPSYSFSMNQ